MILTKKPKLAEEFAIAIPETDSSSSLAKAEALSAVGAAWLSESNKGAGVADFTSATKIVQSVRDLPLGRVSVLISIARAQYEANLRADSSLTLRAAMALAQDLPQRPKPQSGSPRQVELGIHYKDEAFKQILTAAIKERDIPVVNDVIQIWNKSGDEAEGAAVEAWLDVERYEEAIAVSRKIDNPQAKVRALLQIALN